MNGSFIHALSEKPWERCVWMKAKLTLLELNALQSPTLATGSPYDDSPGLLAHGRARAQDRLRKASHPVDVA
jgi:hypothetical protein